MSNEKQVSVIWTGIEQNFVGQVPAGFEFPMSSGGDSPTPMDYLLAGVAGCTAVDIVSTLRKMRQPLQGLRVEATGLRAAEHPKVYTHVTLTYVVTGPVDPDALARAIRLSKEKYCSASIMFQRAGATFDIVSRIESSAQLEAATDGAD